jgi:hypothetical protein
MKDDVPEGAYQIVTSPDLPSTFQCVSVDVVSRERYHFISQSLCSSPVPSVAGSAQARTN